MTFKKLSVMLSAGTFLAVCSNSALAYNGDVKITSTDIRFNNIGQLYISGSDGHAYWGNTTADGVCPAISIQVRQSWLAIAQTALLAGRSIWISYDNCGSGHRGIMEMRAL